MHSTDLLAEISQEYVGLLGVKSVARREPDVKFLLKSGNHVVTRPWTLELEVVHFFAVSTFGMELKLGLAASEILDQTLDQALSDIHEVVHVCICHVEFADGELGVMCQVDAFVTEDAPNFVDAVEATDDELLQIELGSDTEVKIEVEIVMVRDERLGGRASSDHAHHGRLNFEETEGVKEAAEVINYLATSNESAARLLRNDEVQVSLAVASLLVLETEVA